jgi:hypothetical protein
MTVRGEGFGDQRAGNTGADDENIRFDVAEEMGARDVRDRPAEPISAAGAKVAVLGCHIESRAASAVITPAALV